MARTHDRLGRRRRLVTPPRTERDVRIAEPDLIVFEAIARHGPLPATALFEFIKPHRKNANNFKARLARLRAPGPFGPYLEIANSAELTNHNALSTPFWYRLGSATKRIVGTVPQLPRSISPDHDRLVNVVSAYLELTLRGTRFEFIPHHEVVDLVGSQVWEHRGKRRVPDRLMGMRFGEKRRLHPIEVITYSQQQSAAKDKKTIAEMVAWYFSFISGGAYRHALNLGTAGMMPLFVFTGEERMRSAMQHVQPNPFMLYKAVSEKDINDAQAVRGLISEAWNRADHPPFPLG